MASAIVKIDVATTPIAAMPTNAVQMAAPPSAQSRTARSTPLELDGLTPGLENKVINHADLVLVAPNCSHVHVLIGPDEEPEEQVVRAGADARLQCADPGGAPPCWIKGDDELCRTRDPRVQQNHETGDLDIVAAQPSDAGVYSCDVEGRSLRRVKLVVHGN